MKDRKKLNTRGFTIVELMISTAVFSFILLITSAGVIAIGRAYYKSLTSTRVQESARSLMEDVSRSVQFSANGSVQGDDDINNDGVPVAIRVRCFGDDRYTYTIDQRVTGNNNGIYRDVMPSTGCQPSNCFNQPKAGCNGRELLGENMRLLIFDLTGSPPSLLVKIAYGDNDLLSNYNDAGVRLNENYADVQCRAGIAGSNFCAVSQLETSVTSRVE